MANKTITITINQSDVEAVIRLLSYGAEFDCNYGRKAMSKGSIKRVNRAARVARELAAPFDNPGLNSMVGWLEDA